jgi:Cys-rich repeat protein
VRGCYPATECAADSDCPTGYRCEPEATVMPDCAMDPMGCDACGMTISLCVPL